MLAAMQAAPVGDDVYEEDPTVRRLEAACRRPLRPGSRPVLPLGHDDQPDCHQGPLPSR